jgi:hypothetical protein
MAQIVAGQTLTASLLNRKLNRCIARGRRTTNSSSTTSTTSVGVLRLDDKPIRAGVTYRITHKVTGDTTTSTDTLRSLVRYTVDGSTPTTSSTLLPGSGGETSFTSGSSGSTLIVVTDYVPVVDETLSLLLCIQHTLGTSAIIAQADGGIFLTEMYIDDMGDDPGNTGTAV